jgi:hypothetical protein
MGVRVIKLSASVAEPYGFISRHDSALNLGPVPDVGPFPVRADDESPEAFKARAEAWGAPIREWRRPLDVARETGDYTPILVEGARATVFRIRQIPASLWAKLDGYTAGMHETQHAQLIVRVAVIGLDGEVPIAALDKKYAKAVDKAFADLGPIQPEAFVDLLTGNEDVIQEIATHVVQGRKPPGN